MKFRPFLLLFFMVSALQMVQAGDWPRFRGPGGLGISEDSTPPPTLWSPKANVAWKSELPGPGVSSPIIVGNKAVVTCYSGYGLSREEPGDIQNLVRHLLCFDLQSGGKLWQKDIPSTGPEDPFAGIGVVAHGYASHTPVSDGQRIFAYFGKGGLYAYDMDGNELWNKVLGTESDPWAWGSSSSPIIFENTVIVTASAECQAIVGLDKETGKEVWRQEASGLDGMWGTPALVSVENRTDLVMSVPKELWGLDPNNGKLRWYSAATGAEQTHSSLVHSDGVIYAFTGRGGGSVAIKSGGTGDVSSDNLVWEGRDSARFCSPITHESRLYLVANGIVTSIDRESGEKIDQTRLQGATRGGGGMMGSLDYPSPVIAGNNMYYLNGSGQMFVFELGDELKQVSANRVTNDAESFGGTPAISDGQMILRSSKYLYCVKDMGASIDPADNLLAKADSSQGEEGQTSAGGGRSGMGRGGFGGPGGTRGSGGMGRGGTRPGGGPGGSRGGGRGGMGRGGDREDNRPKRPQRPEMAS